MSFKKDKKPLMKFNPTPLKAKLFVATPMYGGMCTGMYASAIMQCVGAFGQQGIQMYYSFMMNESLITRARNSMAYDFLKSDATHLMFIDADIAFNPQDIPKMVDADKDIICGIYPKKEIDWCRVKEAVEHGVEANELHNHTGSFVVNFVDGARSVDVKRNEPFEIENGGTGFMLIKREVFEKLAKKVPSYVSDMYNATEIVTKPTHIKEFFTTSIDKKTGRLMSEDYYFCILARKHGFKVWADPNIDLTHTGTYIFSGATEKVLEGQEIPKNVRKAPKKKVDTKRTAKAKK